MRFADCRLDCDARRLFRREREVHLSPKAFELLKVLVESRPRALSKAELLDRVWPGTFVSDASLARTINEIRDGLGARRARLVRTVYGYGYAFAGAIEGDLSQPQTAVDAVRTVCCLTSREREIPLADGDLVAGRDPDVDICLRSPRVSRRHALFVVSGPSVSVEDLGSKNGTFVNGTRVAGRIALKNGDHVRIGTFTFVLSVALASWSTETEAPA
jgi:DNA-binding winged helix-turn-helix (wHTH) protein